MSSRITITTANTHMGRMLDNLSPVADTDVLLLQEVHPERDDLEAKLHTQTDLRLVLAVGELGLAIAARPEVRVGVTRQYILQERGPIGQALIRMEKRVSSAAAFRTRARGLVTAVLSAPEGSNELTVGTTHPIIPFKWRARNRQVALMGKILADIKGPLIVGGDMNHWPGPRQVDLKMRNMARLQSVDFGTEPTYDISASRHAWIGRVAGRFMMFNGQMDALLYRGKDAGPHRGQLINVLSDHRAISCDFTL